MSNVSSGVHSVPVYNDDNVTLTIRSKDNSSNANLGIGQRATISLPRNQPYLVVSRHGKQDVEKHWDNTNEFRPARDAPARG